MPSVEAVSLAGTSIFLEDCEMVGEVMAKIAISQQRLATKIVVIDPATGKKMDPTDDVLPKVNFVIVDKEDVYYEKELA